MGKDELCDPQMRLSEQKLNSYYKDVSTKPSPHLLDHTSLQYHSSVISPDMNLTYRIWSAMLPALFV